MLILGACSDAVFSNGTVHTRPRSHSGAHHGISALGAVRGLVVDSSGRPLANVLVQWLNIGEMTGDLAGPRGAYTDASGSYRLNVSGVDRASNGWFVLGASSQGHKDDWRNLHIPDTACTWDDKKCDLVANFTLPPE
jgi:hypothetical protein